MKEKVLNNDSGTILISNIPIIGEILYGYNLQQRRSFCLFGWYNGDNKFG